MPIVLYSFCNCVKMANNYLICQQFIEFCGGSMPVRLIILCLYPVLVMICLIKDLKLLAPLSTFSNLCNAVGLVLIFFYLAQGSLVFKESMLEMQSLVDIPVFIGIVLYALEAVGVVSTTLLHSCTLLFNILTKCTNNNNCVR